MKTGKTVKSYSLCRFHEGKTSGLLSREHTIIIFDYQIFQNTDLAQIISLHEIYSLINMHYHNGYTLMDYLVWFSLLQA